MPFIYFSARKSNRQAKPYETIASSQTRPPPLPRPQERPRPPALTARGTPPPRRLRRPALRPPTRERPGRSPPAVRGLSAAAFSSKMSQFSCRPYKDDITTPSFLQAVWEPFFPQFKLLNVTRINPSSSLSYGTAISYYSRIFFELILRNAKEHWASELWETNIDLWWSLLIKF